ncbi:MAG: CarD family transcriptional regulator [Alphaproteobacteria bacterium]|nr:CarD family transcriptional regulator [Alphaproteobacteria bacterium]
MATKTAKKTTATKAAATKAAKSTAKPAKRPVKATKSKASPVQPAAKRSTAAKTVALKKPALQKPTVEKTTPATKIVAKKVAPVKTVAARTPAPATAAKKAPAKKVPAKKAAPKSPPPRKLGNFACDDYVVYPTHGVGQISAIEDQEIAGFDLRLFVVRFEKEKMTLRIPVDKAEEAGLRKLASRQQIETAMDTLRGRSRVSRAMWSRRAQEYEAKINSGDPILIAEVVRDLHRNAGQPDQSYSERQIYEAALERLSREVAAVEKIDSAEATVKLEEVLERVA